MMIELSPTRRNLYDFTLEQLGEFLAQWGWSRYHAEQIWTALYRTKVTSFDAMTSLREEIRARLQIECDLPQPIVERAIDSSDQYTRKFLLRPKPDQAIETVIMAFKGRYTACVSTQAGCAMGCVFCATGQMGFQRHLSAGEIVTQVLHVIRDLEARGETLRNIVLMGMGEPLHNYDNTMEAIEILTDRKGIDLAPRHITLSTVGLPHAIRRLADEQRQVRLAVSLHGATDEERQALVPPAKRWPLAELMAACRYYCEKRDRRIFFEWTLIDGKNDQPEQAHKLGRLLEGLPATVNVIPLNPTIGYGGEPSNLAAVTQFQAILNEYGLRTTVRQRRGIDIAAGCGQLATEATKQ